MRLTISQLQSKHKALVAALKRGEQVSITYHGQLLGIVHPTQHLIPSEEQQAAMDAFFGMHKDSSISTVENELRTVRQGRRKQLHDL
jgi:antitoxin (DNA-binding transcriptional repressor) of toxin-antitoxin stability system